MTSLARWLSALAVALVWIFVGASVVRVLVPVYERLFTQQSSGFELDTAMGPPLAWLLACAMVLGCVIAWRIVRAGPLDAEARGQRSALSVWPGWPISIVGTILAAAALLPGGVPLSAAGHLILGTLGDYTSLGVPLILAAAAAAAGSRGSQATAFLAAPTLLIVSVGFVGEISIANAAMAALAAWAMLAAGFSVLALIWGRELFVWLAIGFTSLAVVALPLGTGLFTPVEMLALVAALAVGNGLLLHTLIDGAFPRRVFSAGAVEIMAVGTAMVFALLGFLLLRVYAVPLAAPAFLSALPPAGIGALAVAAMLVASALVTPVLAITLVIPVFAPLIAGPRIGLLLALAGIAGMCLRAVAWKPGAEPASALRLSPAEGLAAIALLLAVAAVTMLLWDTIAISID